MDATILFFVMGNREAETGPRISYWVLVINNSYHEKPRAIIFNKILKG